MNINEDRIKISESYVDAINKSNLELFDFMKKYKDQVRSVSPLVEFIIERLCSVVQLAIQGCNWDAEIIYRSALEALIKLTFICSATEAEREIRLKEYWQDLREVNSIKQSEQAKRNLELYGHDEIMKLMFTPMILDNEREKYLRTKWSKKQRQALEQKWSFTEMIMFLSKNYFGSSERRFIGLGHEYRYASHVTHGDETGVLIIKERQQRTKAEEDIANLAHCTKLLSNSFRFCCAIGNQITFLAKQETVFYSDLNNSMVEIDALGDKYLKMLQEDSVYDKYR